LCRHQSPADEDGISIRQGLDGSEVLSHIANQKVLLYVHGLSTSFWASIRKGFVLQEQYNVPVLVFSWPANTSFYGYLSARQQLVASVADLHELLNALQAQVSDALNYNPAVMSYTESLCTQVVVLRPKG